MRQGDSSPIHAELIGLADAVELELFRGWRFRRRWRFLTDAAARGYAARLRIRLEARGFFERRGDSRTHVWPGGH